MNLGIIQGRLTSPVHGFQETPPNWLREIELLKGLGLSHIEWVVTSNSVLTNPLYRLEKRIPQISSVCADFLVSDMFMNEDFFLNNMKALCDAVQKMSIPCITVPLLEYSSIEDPKPRDYFFNMMKKVVHLYPEILFSFETELTLSNMQTLFDTFPKAMLTYDTGNNTSYGVAHQDIIELFADRISNVHLKDRKFSGKTVAPGTGDTKISEIFRLLSLKNYSNNFTIQFARGISGCEYITTQKHIKLVKNLYNEYF